MALVVRDVVLNRMRCSRSDDYSAFPLHKNRRVTCNCILALACRAPKLRGVKEHPPPRLFYGGLLNHYSVILRWQPIWPPQMFNNKPLCFFSSNHG